MVRDSKMFNLGANHGGNRVGCNVCTPIIVPRSDIGGGFKISEITTFSVVEH